MWCGQAFSSISLLNNKFLISFFQAEIAAVRDYLAQMAMGAELVGKQFHSSGTFPWPYFMLLDRGYVCMCFYTSYKDTSIDSQGVNLALFPSALVIPAQFLRETSAVDTMCRNMVKGCSFQRSTYFPKHCEVFLWLYNSKYKKAPFPWHNTYSMLPTFQAK